MSLAEKLEKLRQGSAERIPAEIRDVMHHATEGLRASGILERVVKVGDPIPAFALANTAGDTVRSADLLAKGPLVVTYYRGLW